VLTIERVGSQRVATESQAWSLNTQIRPPLGKVYAWEPRTPKELEHFMRPEYNIVRVEIDEVAFCEGGSIGY
jgi:hypothetical protein